MPFVNIRLVEGHSQARKEEIARRVVDAISEVAQLPREAIWLTFDDIAAADWFVAEQSVAAMRKKTQAVAAPEAKDKR